MLQVLVSSDKPVHDPPYFSVTDLDLPLVCVPPPQLLEHDEYCFQLPQRQSTKNDMEFTKWDTDAKI